ncbi:unnamed protein product [Zymoseptoria tritici ST99CH_3D1]|nr:unnamed protein product [Zymoseptoria tritici ST99CH_3D1]
MKLSIHLVYLAVTIFAGQALGGPPCLAPCSHDRLTGPGPNYLGRGGTACSADCGDATESSVRWVGREAWSRYWTASLLEDDDGGWEQVSVIKMDGSGAGIFAHFELTLRCIASGLMFMGSCPLLR